MRGEVVTGPAWYDGSFVRVVATGEGTVAAESWVGGAWSAGGPLDGPARGTPVSLAMLERAGITDPDELRRFGPPSAL